MGGGDEGGGGSVHLVLFWIFPENIFASGRQYIYQNHRGATKGRPQILPPPEKEKIKKVFPSPKTKICLLIKSA